MQTATAFQGRHAGFPGGLDDDRRRRSSRSPERRRSRSRSFDTHPPWKEEAVSAGGPLKSSAPVALTAAASFPGRHVPPPPRRWREGGDYTDQTGVVAPLRPPLTPPLRHQGHPPGILAPGGHYSHGILRGPIRHFPGYGGPAVAPPLMGTLEGDETEHLMTFRTFVILKTGEDGNPVGAAESYEKYKEAFWKHYAAQLFSRVRATEYIKEKYDPSMLARSFDLQMERARKNATEFFKLLVEERFRGISLVEPLSAPRSVAETSDPFCLLVGPRLVELGPPQPLSAPFCLATDPDTYCLCVKKVGIDISRWDILSHLKEVGADEGLLDVTLTEDEPAPRPVSPAAVAAGGTDTSDLRDLQRTAWIQYIDDASCSRAETKIETTSIRNHILHPLRREPLVASYLFRVAPSEACHPKRIRRDLNLSARLISKLDKSFGVDGIFDKSGGEDGQTSGQLDADDTDGMKNHPLLSELPAVLTDTGPRSSTEQLDLQILYLRLVHCMCYYSGKRFSSTREVWDAATPLYVRPLVKAEDVVSHLKFHNNVTPATLAIKSAGEGGTDDPMSAEGGDSDEVTAVDENVTGGADIADDTYTRGDPILPKLEEVETAEADSANVESGTAAAAALTSRPISDTTLSATVGATVGAGDSAVAATMRSDASRASRFGGKLLRAFEPSSAHPVHIIKPEAADAAMASVSTAVPIKSEDAAEVEGEVDGVKSISQSTATAVRTPDVKPPIAHLTFNKKRGLKSDWLAILDARILDLIAEDFKKPLPVDETHPEVKQEWESYCNENTKEVETEKWRCAACKKLFRGPEFVHKHLKNKHGASLEEIITKTTHKEMTNAFLNDPKKPVLLPAPRPYLYRYPEFVQKIASTMEYAEFFDATIRDGPMPPSGRTASGALLLSTSPFGFGNDSGGQRSYRDLDAPPPRKGAGAQGASGNARAQVCYDDL